MAIPALDHLFVGNFERYRDVLVVEGQDQRVGVPARDLVSGEGLARLLAEYRCSQPGDDQRALISLWSRHYFAKLTVPVVVANLMSGHKLPVALDQVEVIMGKDGVPEAFRLPHEGRPFETTPQDSFERFGELLDHNFAPLIEGWCAHIKISRRVLWNNAANYFEWLIRTLESTGVPDSLLMDGQQLVKLNKRPSGQSNPMANPVRYVERGEGVEPQRQRQQCCLRYRLPGLALCQNCPLIDRPPKGARLPEKR